MAHMTAESLRTYALKIDATTGRLLGYTAENNGGNVHVQAIDAHRPVPPPARHTERHQGGDPGARVHAAVTARCRALGEPVHGPKYAQLLREVLADDPELKLQYATWGAA